MSADRRADLFVLASVLMLFLLITADKHIYDLPTALLFTLALLLLEREKFGVYALLFPLVCLNRESAILLPLLFGVHFARRLERRRYLVHLAYQLVVYGTIRLALVGIFAAAPGAPFLVRPLENLQLYGQEPLATRLFLLFVATVGFWIAARWQQAPLLMRRAFALWAPVLVGMYLVSGVSFEVRVFVELLPVVAILGSS